MGWDQKDAVGELLREGDHVKVFRNATANKQEWVDDYIGDSGDVIQMKVPEYPNKHQILVEVGNKGFWVHQSSVMKV